MDGYTEITIFLWGPKISDGNKPPKKLHTPADGISSYPLKFHLFRVSLFHLSLSKFHLPSFPNWVKGHPVTNLPTMTLEVYLHEREQLQCTLKHCRRLVDQFFWGEGFYRIFVGRWLQVLGLVVVINACNTTYRNRPVYAYTHTHA